MKPRPASSLRPPVQGPEDPEAGVSLFRRVFGFAVFGGVLGAVFGMPLFLILIPLGPLEHLVRWFGLNPHSFNMGWIYPALGAALGMIIGAPGGFVADARYRRWAAAQSDIAIQRARPGPTIVPTPGLEEQFRKIFSSLDTVRNAGRVHADGLDFAVGDVSRSINTPDGGSSEQETVACYEPGGLRLPVFMLQPAGGVANLIARVVGMPDLDFPSHPAFSKAYILSTVSEEDVRTLFNDRVLTELDGRPGLHVESVGDMLAVYLPDRLLERGELADFMATAARIVHLLEESARAAGFTDTRVVPRQDVKAVLDKLPGLGGMQARRTLVTRADAEAFARQPPPRRIPKNIDLYRERMAPQMSWGMGVLFVIVGTFFALSFANQALAPDKGGWDNNWGGMAMGLAFVAAGAPLAFFGGRARYRLRRLLRHGRSTMARIEKVEAMAQISGLTVTYRHEGRQVRASGMFTGPGLERARKLFAAGESASILYDPAMPERMLFVDDLISVGPELEP